MNSICHYKENEQGYWNSDCGKTFDSITWHDYARDFFWCPYCGSEMNSEMHMSKQDLKEDRGDRAHQERKDDEE
jgi:DNA-directed RNA polymerase subunit RPC12/RpoP